jgi:hypothetical protein
MLIAQDLPASQAIRQQHIYHLTNTPRQIELITGNDEIMLLSFRRAALLKSGSGGWGGGGGNNL